MRVLYLFQYFTALRGSGSTRAYEFAKRLIKNGHDVTVVTTAGYLPDEYQNLRKITRTQIEGIPVIILPVDYSHYMSFRRRIFAFAKFAILATWICLRESSDVIYASSGPLTIAIPSIIGKYWQRIPVVFEVRDLWPEIPIAIGALKNPLTKRLARFLEWFAYHQSAHIVALSPGMAEGVGKRGVKSELITVIPNSSDIDLFDVPLEAGCPVRKRLGIEADTPLIVYTGAFGYVNNVIYLVKIADEMQRIAPECHFLLVGKGVKFKETYDYAVEHNLLNKNVFIWQSIPKHEMPSVLSASTITTSTVITIPEMWKNSANKFFDSLAAGRPIAVNYGGWQADLLKETGAGIQIDECDPVLASEQLAEFFQDQDRVNRARVAARELALSHFNRDDMAKKLENVLIGVVQSTH